MLVPSIRGSGNQGKLEKSIPTLIFTKRGVGMKNSGGQVGKPDWVKQPNFRMTLLHPAWRCELLSHRILTDGTGKGLIMIVLSGCITSQQGGVRKEGSIIIESKQKTNEAVSFD